MVHEANPFLSPSAADADANADVSMVGIVNRLAV